MSIFHVDDAADAYRESAYRDIEYNIDSSVHRAGLPILGGLIDTFKSVGNHLMRPIRVAKAFLVGGHYDPRAVMITEVPQEMSHSKYGEALLKTREYKREQADTKANGLKDLLSFHFKSYFQNRRMAAYNDSQMNRVIMPDENMDKGSSMIGSLAHVGASAFVATHPDMLGNLSAPFSNVGSPAGKTIPAFAA